MVQQINMPPLELGGSPEEQSLASQIWNLMRMRGSSYAVSRPIMLSLDQLAEYYAGQKYQGLEKTEEVAPLIDHALSASPAVFLREESQAEEVPASADAPAIAARVLVTFKTTKSGKAPPQNVVLDQHSFQTRLNQSARPVLPPTEEELAARAAEHTAHPTQAPALNLPKAAPVTAEPAPRPTPLPVASAPAPTVATPPPARPTVAQPAPVTASAPATPPASPAPVLATPPPVASRPAATPPPAPAAPRPAAVPSSPAPASPSVSGPIQVDIADGLNVDINRPVSEVLSEYGDYFATALHSALEDDFRFVNFDSDWYLEEITGRYNKGDFRRIREYMADVAGPVSDTAILSDLYGKRTTDHDYEATRFALNFRLYKEKKEFEFVGAADDRVWTAPGLPQIGNPLHKATEVGTDFKYLEDPALSDPSELTEENGQKVWRHTLTFYEHENGVLPYDATARQLFPAPLMEEQKSLILRFEAPQVYFTYTAELRYPSGSRGGWLGGLEGFFADNLVPGAVLVIRQAQKSNHFTIEYEQSDEQEANVLLYDERRQKFVFRPIVFACAVVPGNVLTSERYNKLNGQKRLEESERKKTDNVVASAFEIAGQRSTQGYAAVLDDLYPVANIERPFSRNYLRQLLSHGNSMFQEDETTPDLFSYKPPTSGVRR